MQKVLLILTELGILLFFHSGLIMLFGILRKKPGWSRFGAAGMAIIGPITLAVCWNGLLLFREENTVFWSRLMAGNESVIFALGALGIIAGSGLAMGALSLGDKMIHFGLAALSVSLSWIVLYLHPTPHYVPMPPWADKAVWFLILVGGSVAGFYVYTKLRSLTLLTYLKTPLYLAAGIPAVLSLSTLSAHYQASQPIDLQPLSAQERITSLGCLACHSMEGVGYSDPGGGLESVASRNVDTLRAFLLQPDAETAVELGIRDDPTGEMAGVQLTEEQVDLLVEALQSLFEVKPPSSLGPGSEQVEAIFVEKTCLACHTVSGEGAPQGGIGGPLEASAKHSREVLIEWLQNPSAETATRLNIREQPMGAMQSFSLTQEQSEIVADWLLTLQSP